MSKIAVIYWSGTGNTEIMANAVADGVKEKGGEVSIFTALEFNESMINLFDGFAFGCPSMGDEVLEESEFEPMFDLCKTKLGDKRIALFGSYGWGDGEWMENWEESCSTGGLVLTCNSVICNDAPDDHGIVECKALGEALV